MSKIVIYKDLILAGAGRIDSAGEIVDCASILGENQDESDETYLAISDAIDDEPRNSAGLVVRPDGVYSWEITK